MLGNIVVIFLLIALNAFFVSVEFAGIASRRSRLDLMADENNHAARLVRSWLEKPAARDRLIAASQLGITACSLALGAVGENTVEALVRPAFEEMRLPGWLAALNLILPLLPLIISLMVVTALHMVLGEQVPKVAVLRSPERFALFAAPLMNLFAAVFKWFIDLTDGATHVILAIFGIRSAGSHSLMYTLDEIREMVNGPETEGIIEKSEREMISAVLDLGEMIVRHVSIPRTEIIAVEADTPVSEIVDVAVRNGITKLPVFEQSLDQIVGVIHLRDLLLAVQEQTQDKTARDLAREALFVPETIAVRDLLRQFRARRTHIAIVLDEFGGTAGLVTLEDLLDEIIGEVQDVFDASPPPIQMLPDGSASIDGMTLMDDINERFGLHLSNPDYDTIAGYILGKMGRIPKEGDVVEDLENGIALRVESMDRLRIARVILNRL